MAFSASLISQIQTLLSELINYAHVAGGDSELVRLYLNRHPINAKYEVEKGWKLDGKPFGRFMNSNACSSLCHY